LKTRQTGKRPLPARQPQCLVKRRKITELVRGIIAEHRAINDICSLRFVVGRQTPTRKVKKRKGSSMHLRERIAIPSRNPLCPTVYTCIRVCMCMTPVTAHGCARYRYMGVGQLERVEKGEAPKRCIRVYERDTTLFSPFSASLCTGPFHPAIIAGITHTVPPCAA